MLKSLVNFHSFAEIIVQRRKLLYMLHNVFKNKRFTTLNTVNFPSECSLSFKVIVSKTNVASVGSAAKSTQKHTIFHYMKRLNQIQRFEGKLFKSQAVNVDKSFVPNILSVEF